MIGAMLQAAATSMVFVEQPISLIILLVTVCIVGSALLGGLRTKTGSWNGGDEPRPLGFRFAYRAKIALVRQFRTLSTRLPSQ